MGCTNLHENKHQDGIGCKSDESGRPALEKESYAFLSKWGFDKFKNRMLLLIPSEKEMVSQRKGKITGESDESNLWAVHNSWLDHIGRRTDSYSEVQGQMPAYTDANGFNIETYW